MTTATRTSLGRYLVEAEIGRGAMGVVYRGRDPKIDRTVAIKTISLAGKEPAEEHEYRERFVQEARAAGRLSHPGIVTIFDAGEDPESHEPYFVMEYVEGDPLSDTLSASGGKLPFTEALRLTCELAEALQYAHERGVIHGDIKPANILINAQGHAKIADFGVARLNQSVATHAGKIFGSPAYMAPEQLSGGEPDARSDLFSLGVMLYSMLTGFRPFQGNSAQTVCFKVMNVEPVPVTSFQAELTPELDRIVARSIAKVPSQRYQSGAEMAAEIRAFMRNDSSFEEATAFFSRVLEKDAEARRQRPRIVSKRVLWEAAGAMLLFAWIFTGWQMAREFREAEALIPPVPALPAAPPISKTPPLAKVLRPAKKPVHYKLADASPAPLQTVETANLRVEILHHFTSGKAMVWVDHQLVFDQELRGNTERHPIFRTVEMNQTANLQLAVGKHEVEVHVTSPGGIYDDTEALEANLTSGPEHVLYVNCDKRKMQVKLQ